MIKNTFEYQVLAKRTAKDMGTTQLNLIHAAMGLSSDAGEFVDAIKKHTIYGKELDKENCIEELGDVLWFVSLACDTLGVSMAEVMQANIEKLALRYPDKYTDEHAIRRVDKFSGQEFDKVIVDELLPTENEERDTELPNSWGLTKEQLGSN